MKKSEQQIQIQVSEYLKKQYPDVIFCTDIAAGMKLTIGQAIKAQKMRSSRGLPDLNIFESRNGYSGLLIELKKDGIKILKKNGELIADSHIHEQAAMITRLREKGYKAEFAVGFEMAKEIIDTYLT